MNRDDIDRLVKDQMKAYYNGDYMDSSDAKLQLYVFANLVAAAERNACAQIVEREAMTYSNPVWAVEIVNDIRARSKG